MLCTDVMDRGNKLIIGDIRADRAVRDSNLPGPASMIAWAGVPVYDQDGRVAGVLWAADREPRQWTVRDVAVLETLAQVASSEVALRAALARSARRAALAATLEESLLPPRLPNIPGLQVAARYAAGGPAAKVLGDFCDVFPSAGGTWGTVVGDVCGKGSAAAKCTALARSALRALARKRTRPSLILADLNQVLLDWPTGRRGGGHPARHADVRRRAAQRQRCRAGFEGPVMSRAAALCWVLARCPAAVGMWF